MFEKLGEIIIHAGIVQGVFATVLFAGKKGSRFLIPLVICFSIIVSHSYYFGHLANQHIESPFVIAEPFIFLISPLLYFHFRKIAGLQNSFKPFDIVHLLPFIFFFLSFIPVFFFGRQTLYYQFLYGNPIVLTAFLWIILIVQFLFYWRKLRMLNILYENRLQEERSQYRDYDASWIKTFMILFLVILVFVTIILTVFIHTSRFEHFNQIMPVFFSLALYFVTFKGLNQKTIPEREKERPPAPSPDENILKLRDQLSEFMQKEKPYLNPELTLKDLAVQFGITRNQLSYLINNGFNSNFYLFINEYRVNHLKRLMREDKAKNFTIVSLAFDSGFNSKSSFNAVFKKITGLTPSEYLAGL